MNNLIIAVVILILVGIGSSYAASYFNRRARGIEKRAEDFVRQRLMKRKSISLIEFFKNKNFSNPELSDAESVIEKISNIINITKDKFYPDDKLGEILEVKRQDLFISDAEWEKAKIGNWDHVVPFIDDIYSYFELHTNINKLENHQRIKLPKTEDEWDEFFMNTKLIDLVEILSKISVFKKDKP